MKRISELPRYKKGWASELEWRGPDNKTYEVWHSFHSYGIGLGMRAFVQIEAQWYELNGDDKREGILW